MRTPSSPSTFTSSPRAQVRPPTIRSTVVPGRPSASTLPSSRPAPRRRAGRSAPARRRSRSALRPGARCWRPLRQPAASDSSRSSVIAPVLLTTATVERARGSLVATARGSAPGTVPPAPPDHPIGRARAQPGPRCAGADQPLALARPGGAVEHHRISDARAFDLGEGERGARELDGSDGRSSRAARNSARSPLVRDTGAVPSASHSAGAWIRTVPDAPAASARTTTRVSDAAAARAARPRSRSIASDRTPAPEQRRQVTAEHAALDGTKPPQRDRRRQSQRRCDDPQRQPAVDRDAPGAAVAVDAGRIARPTAAVRRVGATEADPRQAQRAHDRRARS